MKSKKLGMMVVVLVGALVWWGTQHYAAAEATLPPLHTERVDRGDVSQRVIAHGSLQPVKRFTVSLNAPARSGSGWPSARRDPMFCSSS